MADMKSFGKRMLIRARNVRPNTEELMKKVAIQVDQALVMATPVDEGRAKSNWRVELDKRGSGTIDAYYPGISGSTAYLNQLAAIIQARKKVDSYQQGQEIHIFNNLPYINRLNNGHSGQAPVGFVEIAITEAIESIKDSRIISNLGKSK